MYVIEDLGDVTKTTEGFDFEGTYDNQTHDKYDLKTQSPIPGIQ